MTPRNIRTRPQSFSLAAGEPRRRLCHASQVKALLLAGACASVLLPQVASADILDQYTFGPNGTTPGILSPTTVSPNVTATDISGDAGLAPLDLSSPATQPASSPYLRVTFVAAETTAAAAVASNSDFKFTLTANPGFMLNLTSLTFDVERGGASTPRGYDVRSSVDNFATSLGSADAGTARPTFTNVSINLSSSVFQGLSTITFKIYSYSPGTGSSVDYDNVTVNGTTATLPFAGYTWKGNTSANWDTTTANWSGTGTVYADGTATSDTLFDDTTSVKTVNVTPAAVNPRSVIVDTASTYTFNGSAVAASSGFTKKGTGTATINNAFSAALAAVTDGSLAISATGSLTTPSLSVLAPGSLTLASGATLSSTAALKVTGQVTFNGATQTIAGLDDLVDTTPAGTGLVTLNGTALTITGTSQYNGAITGTGSVIKNAPGTLTLRGFNDFTGGLTINGGALQLGAATAAGSGGITVNSGGSLALGAAITNAITLAGGTIGVAAAQTIPANITVTSASTVDVFNPVTTATPADLILTGTLSGTGDLNVVSKNGNAPDGAAFRLRGPASDYSGKITLGQSAKFELQTSSTTGSPMGTGTLVMTGGTTSATNAGTYSIVNVRNNSAAGAISDTTFGNNVRITGTGAAFFNLLGSVAAGSVSNFGDLAIGDGQTVAAVATASAAFTLGFASVHLQGGTATFTPQPVGNTSFLATENITLGPISETVPGSGIQMNGSATLTLGAANTYTGPTTIVSGTVVLNGSIGGSTTTLSGGLLRGGGTTGPLNLTGGTLAPGDGIGKLSTGNLALSSGTLALEIAGNTPGVANGYDQLSVTGSVLLDSLINLTLDFGFYDPVDGADTFVIVSNDQADPVTLTGTGGRLAFNGTLLNEGSIFTATSGFTTQDFRVSYVGGDGNDITLFAIPEPASAATLLGTAAALAGFRRCRRRVA